MTIIRVTKNSLQPNVDLQAYKNEVKEILSSKSPQWIFAYIKKKKKKTKGNPAYMILRAGYTKILSI